VTFATTLLIFLALLAALGTPLWIVATRDRRTTTVRNFAIGATLVAVLCALMAQISERQVAQCEAAGNPSCVDYGTSGLQLVLVFFFVVGAWWSAYSIWRG
jgi:hypothetical protein